MAQNTNVTELDTAQALKRSFDSTNDALRVDIISSLASSIEIDSVTDSITNVPKSSVQKASLTSASTGTVIAAFSVVGVKTIQLYTNTTATLTGPQACTVEVSPSDTDDVWIATSITVTESGTNATVIAGTSGSICARRARVKIAAAISTGAFDLYAVAQAI